MYCPNCGVQADPQIKFCKSCGLKLGAHARLLEDPQVIERYRQIEAQGADQLGSGATLLIVAYFCLLILSGVLGATTLSPWMLALVLTVFLLLGGKATAMIHRSGLFGFLKVLHVRRILAEAEKKSGLLDAALEETRLPAVAGPPNPDAASVAEDTTRKLREAANTTRKMGGE